MASSDTETHKIVIRRANKQKGQATVVSCRCREQPPKSLVEGRPGSGRPGLNPIGEVRDWNEAVVLYNNPENHYAPLDEEHKLGRKRWISGTSPA